MNLLAYEFIKIRVEFLNYAYLVIDWVKATTHVIVSSIFGFNLRVKSEVM